MDSDTSIFKWVAAAMGVIIICFCIGYFLLGPTAHPAAQNGSGSTVIASAAGTGTSPSTAVTARPSAPVDNGSMIITEKTAEIEAKKKKQEEEAKKKAEEEAKKAQEEAQKKAEEEAKLAAAAAASPTPTPTLSATDTPSPTPSDDAAGTNTNPTDNGAPHTPPGSATPTTVAPTPAPTASRTIYRVRVGSFESRDAARGMAAELNGRGYATSIVNEGSVFRIQVGAYRDEKAAKDVQKELKANGYDATVSG